MCLRLAALKKIWFLLACAGVMLMRGALVYRKVNAASSFMPPPQYEYVANAEKSDAQRDISRRLCGHTDERKYAPSFRAESSVINLSDEILMPTRKYLPASNATLRFLNVGLGTTATHLTHKVACELSIPSCHYAQCCHASGLTRKLAHEVVQWYTRMKRCTAGRPNPRRCRRKGRAVNETMPERIARKRDAIFQRQCDEWRMFRCNKLSVEEEVKSLLVKLRKLVQSGIVALHDAPYTHLVPELLGLAPDVRLIQTVRDPDVWSRKRVGVHMGQDLVCDRDVARLAGTGRRVPTHWNIVQCLHRGRKSSGRPGWRSGVPGVQTQAQFICAVNASRREYENCMSNVEKEWQEVKFHPRHEGGQAHPDLAAAMASHQDYVATLVPPDRFFRIDAFSNCSDQEHDLKNMYAAHVPVVATDMGFQYASLPRPQCKNVSIHFPSLPVLESQEQKEDKRRFLDRIAGKHPSEILAVNRSPRWWTKGEIQYITHVNSTEEPPFPYALRLFDWRVLRSGNGTETVSTHPNPQSVYCDTKRLELCLKTTKRLQPLKHGEKRVLALGHCDKPWLSNAGRIVQQLRDSGLFSKVLYEAKDIRMEGIHSLPQALNSHYIEFLYGPDKLMSQIRVASFEKKTGGVLAAWGEVYKNLDQLIPSRAQAAAFAKKSCLVRRQSLPPSRYLDELARHRFLLAPTGQAIFAPKLAEALLLLTIPIVQREPDGGAWEELRDVYGWPLVIVDKWREVTQQNLTRWWEELAPKLQAARMNLLADSWFETVMS